MSFFSKLFRKNKEAKIEVVESQGNASINPPQQQQPSENADAK